MISFIFSHIRTNIFRSFSLFLFVFICIGSTLFLTFFYQNIVSALTYYTYDVVDTSRFTLKSDTNILTLFSKNTPGLPPSLMDTLRQDPRLEDVQAYTLVELPVLGKFSFFQFGLDIDIPTFALTDGYLSGASIPIGISRAMIDFYNIQLAGSSPLFPNLSESFLIGQSVGLTFGESRIFPPLSEKGSPVSGKIVQVSDDFPGFGIVLPESIVRAKMSEIGYTLGNPYKIVAYMRDPSQKNSLQEVYRGYNPVFDIDNFQVFQSRITLLQQVFFGICIVFASILAFSLVLMLFSFFRERRDIFLMVSIFGLSGFRARMMTLAEPLILIFSGFFIGAIVFYFLIVWVQDSLAVYLSTRGILFPMVGIDGWSVGVLALLCFLLFSLLVLSIESRWRKQILLR